MGKLLWLRISARSLPSDPQLYRGATDEPPTASKSASLPPPGRQNVLCSRSRPRSQTFMNARNFVDYTSDRSQCESRMREICTYGLTRRRARPARPSLLYCFKKVLEVRSRLETQRHRGHREKGDRPPQNQRQDLKNTIPAAPVFFASLLLCVRQKAEHESSGTDR